MHFFGASERIFPGALVPPPPPPPPGVGVWVIPRGWGDRTFFFAPRWGLDYGGVFRFSFKNHDLSLTPLRRCHLFVHLTGSPVDAAFARSTIRGGGGSFYLMFKMSPHMVTLFMNV